MFLPLQPYRSDSDGFDWKLILFLAGLFRAPNPYVFIGALMITVFVLISIAMMLLAQMLWNYWQGVYEQYGRNNKRTGLILLGLLVGSVLTVLGAYTLWSEDTIWTSTRDMIVVWTVFIFVVGTLGVEKYEEHRSSPRPLPWRPSHIKHYLSWKKSQPTNNTP